jgi:hypothetical protein
MHTGAKLCQSRATVRHFPGSRPFPGQARCPDPTSHKTVEGQQVLDLEFAGSLQPQRCLQQQCPDHVPSTEPRRKPSELQIMPSYTELRHKPGPLMQAQKHVAKRTCWLRLGILGTPDIPRTRAAPMRPPQEPAPARVQERREFGPNWFSDLACQVTLLQPQQAKLNCAWCTRPSLSS